MRYIFTMTTQAQFSEALSAARETRRQSQEDLAYALGCDRKTVGRWEAGKHKVSRMFRRQLSAIYPELAKAQG
jgi:transcriptional regulator with XRE-family HTH domain